MPNEATSLAALYRTGRMNIETKPRASTPRGKDVSLMSRFAPEIFTFTAAIFDIWRAILPLVRSSPLEAYFGYPSHPRFNKSSYRLRTVCTNRILSKIRPRLVTTDIDRGHLFSVCSPALFSCTASAAFRTLVPLCHRISCCAGRSWIGLARLELDPCRR
jgi:hypothetical protein